ncbi:nitrite reductase large subunit NirB [Actinomycetospora sp. TBRC 11914]|uniref:nitrite reductase large subunit NirB n=1 Tax=Actinomycetospora sp. TBRC 11914 TaxID=2729387 RepID=UPI00145C635D|nr:nitrite reductase large subunit NirB [Actinomycetospora sp. TBRC 11914]NMO92010.1 NAD(P)/FAD-dependent oxidoreductase [Actinomycetospora sp. TBRC 11914]
MTALEEPTHRTATDRDTRAELVVVGNGMSGARALEEILARGGDEMFAITVFGDEPYGNYNRILLSEVLANAAGQVVDNDDVDGDDEDELFLNPRAWYDDNGITLHAGVRVVRIDRHAKVVYGDDGSVTPYDTLVLATGSRSFFPPMDGMWASDTELTPGVFGFRSLDDATGMLRHVAGDAAMRSSTREDGKRSAVVIGGGLLGLEAAAGLQAHGLAVHVVHPTEVLMNQQLEAQASAVLRSKLEDMGMHMHLGVKTSEILLGDDGAVSGVRFTDGSTLGCDTVVVTAGIRPNIGLAVVSGLETQRAIVVDDRMRSVDDDDIFVVGECAQHRGEVYGVVGPLWEQAAVLADVVTGADPGAEYHGSRLATKLKVAGVDVAQMGVKSPERESDEFVQFSETGRGVYQTVVIRDGTLIGATLVGDISKAAALTQAFDSRSALPEERIRLLFDLGSADDGTSAADLPDDTQICNCNGVSKGDLVACVEGGAESVSACMAATRAGKGCGSCKGLVTEVVEAALGGEGAADPADSYYVPAIPMDKPTLMAEIRSRGLTSVSAVFEALAPDGKDHVGSKMGLTALLRMMWPDDVVDERDGRFINDRVHGNIQRDGTFSVVPRMSGGVTTPAQLRRIADVAEKHDIPMVKLTGGQRIDLLGVPKEKLQEVWADLDMPSGWAYGKSFRTVKTCVGTDFCRFGLGDSTQLGIDLEERYKGIEGPAKMKLGVSGCPRNCAESMVKDVGLVAIEGPRWQIYVGGAAGATVRQGEVLATVDSHDEALRLVGRFLQYYREHANWLERTYDFVPRMGLEYLKAVVVDDAEGLADGLDARMQEAVDAYADPWATDQRERTPGQFHDALPIIPLPQVPVRSSSGSPA